MSRQNVELVTDNYYSKEASYQREIDKRNRAENLKESIVFNLEQSENRLEINFPDGVNKRQIKGRIYIYRPSDRSLDFNIPVSASDNLKQIIPLDSFKKGLWRIRINWSMENENFLSEYKFTLK